MQKSVISDSSLPTKRVRFNSTTKQWEDAPKKPLFLKGPIPIPWLSEAAKLPGKAINLALAIQWLVGMSGGKPVKITATALEYFAISKDAYRDGLNRLEAAGLIKVERTQGAKPLVSINIKNTTNLHISSE